MNRDRLYLLDILEAIARIEKYTDQGFDAFDRDELVQSWVVRHLQIIGEASRAISPELKAQHPEVPWAVIVRARNIIVHHYFGIDLDIVRGIVENDLPGLKSQVATLLQTLSDPEDSGRSR